MLAPESVPMKVRHREIATGQIAVKAPPLDFETAAEESSWRCPVRVVSTTGGCRVVRR